MKAVKDMLTLLTHAMNREGITLRRFTIWMALLLSTGATVFSALNHGFSTEREERIRNIFSKTLEELVEMEVTSVTGVEHEWLETPAAVHVITSDDIRRSGHRHLAEILRMAPGMNVGKIDSWHWAVTARTFNDIWVSKQLVLVDGREVYGQWLSGVFWEFEDFPVDLIDKIEITRGPGATVWGINAMNGVINIRTKKAADIDGTTVTAGFGTEQRGFRIQEVSGCQELASGGPGLRTGLYGHLHPRQFACLPFTLIVASLRCITSKGTWLIRPCRSIPTLHDLWK
jgi:outer membrane cobalamin receptor